MPDSKGNERREYNRFKETEFILRWCRHFLGPGLADRGTGQGAAPAAGRAWQTPQSGRRADLPQRRHLIVNEV